jgi:hypothetical protein
LLETPESGLYSVKSTVPFFQLKAAEVWAAMPFEGHQGEKASQTTVLIEREVKRPAAAHSKKP